MTFDLRFRGPEKGVIPFSPIADVTVETYSTSGPNGPIVISSECVTVREMEAQIAYLKAELDQVLAKARQKFAKY